MRPGHVVGFFYTFCILLQGSLPYTQVHVWRWWRVALEVFVAVHGAMVAYFVQGSTTMWRMFLFGFLLIFVATQQFGLDVGGLWGHVAISVVYVVAVAAVYLYQRAPPRDLNELVRIAVIEYGFVFVIWLVVALSVYCFGAAAVQEGGASTAAAVVVMTLLLIVATMGSSELFECIARRAARRKMAEQAKQAAAGGGGGGDVAAGGGGDRAVKREVVAIKIGGKLYDVTEFVEEHPGGGAVLRKYAGGKDATAAFQRAEHPEYAVAMMSKYVVESEQQQQGGSGDGGGDGGTVPLLQQQQ